MKTNRTARLAILIAATLAPTAAAAAPHDLQVRTARAADGTPLEVTTGIVRVPASHRDPAATAATAATIDLAFVRIRRDGVAGRRAHMILAGGPGDSGVDLALGLARQGGKALADLLDGDLIGFDQRGTGASSPSLASEVRYELPADRPGSPEAWLPPIAKACRAVADDLRARGIDLSLYNTRESADDVDAVREALGYPRITLWGRSYGSHLALATLRRHPAMIERMVLVSPEGPNHTWKLPAAVDAVLERIGDRAGRPAFCGQVRDVLATLERSPAEVATTHPLTGRPVTVTLSAFDVRLATAAALADPRTLATLPAAYARMAAGDFRQVAQVVLLSRERMGVGSAMRHAMDLSSAATADRVDRIRAEARTALLGNAINFPGMDLGDAWGAADLGDEFRAPVAGDVPTLIVVGDLDARTPVENAREIAATLPNARVVVVENAAHQFDFFGSRPMRATIAAFLAGGPTPERLVNPPLKFAD